MARTSISEAVYRTLTDGDFRDRVLNGFDSLCIEEGYHLTLVERRTVRLLAMEMQAIDEGGADGGVLRPCICFAAIYPAQFEKVEPAAAALSPVCC